MVNDEELDKKSTENNYNSKAMLWALLITALIVIILIFISTYASAFEIVPDSLNVTGYVAQITQVPLRINNLYDYDLYNISILNNSYFTMTPISKLSYNSSVNANLTLYTKELLSNKSISVTFIFYRKQNITLQTNTTTVNINSGAFNPGDIAIVQGSTVIWYNNDTILHNAQDTGNPKEFDSGDIMPGQSYSHVFNTIKYYSYRDYYFSFYGSVNVIGSQQEVFTHDNSKDITKNFVVSTSYAPSNLSAEMLTNNFSMLYNETKDGIINIINNGSSTIYNIHLEGDWLSFNKDHFNLNSQSSTYVTYTVTPFIFRSEDTNQTYNNIIYVSSDNAPTVNSTLTVFINYSAQMFGNTTTDLAALQYYNNIFCPAHPTSIFCNQTPQVIYVNHTEYQTPPTYVNYTPEELANLKNLTAEGLTRQNNFMAIEQAQNDIRDSQYSNTSHAVLDLNETIAKLQDAQENQMAWLITGICVVFVSAGLVCGILIFTTAKRQNKFKYDNTF